MTRDRTVDSAAKEAAAKTSQITYLPLYWKAFLRTIITIKLRIESWRPLSPQGFVSVQMTGPGALNLNEMRYFAAGGRRVGSS